MNLYNFLLKLLAMVLFLIMSIIKTASAQIIFDNLGNIHLTETLRGNSDTQNNPSPKAIKMIFPGAKLSANYQFAFPDRFEEINIQAKDSIKLNAVLFKADSSKGVILYLHGNIGALDEWGKIAKTYTTLHYDLLMIDYRGYGKSEGRIKNENQLYSDVQKAYDYLLTIYPENKIIVLGYSIGTGPAAWLAANNHLKY